MSCRRVIACFSVASCTLGINAQQRVIFESPSAVSLQLNEVYLRNDLELQREVQEAGIPPTTVTRQRIRIEPAVGLGFAGWAYHPNLLQYTAQTELGLDWQDSREDPGDSGTDSRFLQRYHFAVDVLKQKPFATGLFADKDVAYRDYDFFSRVRVDSESYGARSGYSAGPVPFSASAQHYEEKVEDLLRPTWMKEDTVTFNASNSRRSEQGTTYLSYNLNNYTRQDNGYSTQKGLNQNVSLFDGEKFGPGGRAQLNSLLNFSSVTETAEPSDKLLLQETLRLQHTPRLASFYDYTYNLATLGDSDSGTHQARAGLTHQLYDNLTSTLDGHGVLTSADSPGSSLDYRRYGVTLNEQYTRPIQSWANLWLGYQGSFDREERDSTGGRIEIISEPHALTDGTLTFLNQKSVVLSSIRVKDSTSTITYVRGLDYLVIPHFPMTEIRRVPGGQIPNGALVLVDYVAALDPSAEYYAFQNSVSFRLDFWKGLLGVYARWSKLDYSGGEQLNLRWLDDKTVGADTTWRWLRAGAEYEVVDSNYSPYSRVRLFQSAQFPISGDSTVGLDLDQGWATFPDEDRHQTTFGAIARFQLRLSSALSWNTEGGVRIERGETFDRDYGTVRSELDYLVGRLAVKVGYEYGHESHPTDLRENHFFYFRFRRNF